MTNSDGTEDSCSFTISYVFSSVEAKLSTAIIMWMLLEFALILSSPQEIYSLSLFQLLYILSRISNQNSKFKILTIV